MDKYYHRTKQEDIHDERDYLFNHVHDPENMALILPKVDLRHRVDSPIIDQGLLNSCSACALTVAVEHYMKAEDRLFPHHHIDSVNASSMYIYYNERVMRGVVNQNVGVYIRDGVKSLAKNGVCCEELWPYPDMPFPDYLNEAIARGDSEALINAIVKAQEDNAEAIASVLAQKPSDEALTQASNYKVPKYYKLELCDDLAQLRLALSLDIPFVFGIYEPESFFHIDKTGIMPIPPVDEVRLGGHAMVALGYDDDKQHFIIRNSYGDDFGDNGDCYIPYEFIKGQFNNNGKMTNNAFSFWCLIHNDD